MSNELQELDSQIAELQAKKQAILDSKRALVLEETRSNVRQYSFTASELGLAGAAVRKAVAAPKEAKYANPLPPFQTWAGGKGAIPKWVKAHTEAGGDIEDLRIKK